MADCQTTFNTPLQSPPNPIFESSDWSYGDGQHNIDLTFDRTMATDTVPALASWQIKIDAVTRDVTSRSWLDTTTLRLVTDLGDMAADTITAELLVTDPLLTSSMHKVVLPFGPETIYRVV